MTENAIIEKLLNQSNDPDAYALIEQLTAAIRAGTVEDICIDLADFGETEAVAIIRTNY